MIHLRPNITMKVPVQQPATQPVAAPAVKMPALTRETLAMRLRQNWIAKHPVDAPTPSNGSLDDSLTSLNWLHNLNIMKIGSPTPPSSPQPGDSAPGCMMSPANPMSGSMQVNPNSILNVTNVPRAGEKIDYKNNPHVKPPYSYATLICMAMKESKKNKVTLSGIYSWITENFMYYRMADPSWQNSIRHNLSLNKCFQKVPRRKDEPGKGGFWRINPEYQDMFVNGVFKKRRGSTACPPMISTAAPPMKRMKSSREEEDYQATLSITGGGGGVLPSASVLLTPATPGSMNGPLSPLTDIKIKKEPGLSEQMAQVGARAESALNGNGLDFSWSAILNQDIEVDGTRVKTEDIIDDKEATAIMELSPPPSDDSSSDVALDEFLTFPANAKEGKENATDLTTGQPLDLSIQGTSLKPPEWWAENFNGQVFQPNNGDAGSGLHTPIHAPSPEYNHPWAESRAEDLDQAIASFDTDIFFEMENITGLNSLSQDS